MGPNNDIDPKSPEELREFERSMQETPGPLVDSLGREGKTIPADVRRRIEEMRVCRQDSRLSPGHPGPVSGESQANRALREADERAWKIVAAYHAEADADGLRKAALENEAKELQGRVAWKEAEEAATILRKETDPRLSPGPLGPIPGKINAADLRAVEEMNDRLHAPKLQACGMVPDPLDPDPSRSYRDQIRELNQKVQVLEKELAAREAAHKAAQPGRPSDVFSAGFSVGLSVNIFTWGIRYIYSDFEGITRAVEIMIRGDMTDSEMGLVAAEEWGNLVRTVAARTSFRVGRS